MAAPVICISVDCSEESVGSSPSIIILSNTVMPAAIPPIVPAIIPLAIHDDIPVLPVEVPIIPPIASEVKATVVALPARVLDMVIYSSTDSGSSEDPSLEHTAILPSTSLFLSSSNSFETSGDHSDSLRSSSFGQEIPFGRPYRTQLNRVYKMMTARKRVRPLSSLPSYRTASRHPSKHSLPLPSPRKRRRLLLDTPTPTADDTPIPRRFVYPPPIRTLWDSVAYLRWRAAPLSTMYPSTTSDSSSEGSSSDLSSEGSSSDLSFEGSSSDIPVSSSERLSHSSATKSPATSVPSATHRPGALSPIHDDLLPCCKSFRGPSATSSPEDSIEESLEVGSETDIDSNIFADIEVDITVKAATTIEGEAGVEAKDEIEGDDKANFEYDAESSVVDIVKIRVDVVVEPEVPDDIPVPTIDERFREHEDVIQELYDHMIRVSCSERARLLDRVRVLEGSNMRLREALSMEREWVDSVWHYLGYVQKELREIRSFRYYDMMDFRRLETFAMRRLGYHVILMMIIIGSGMTPEAIKELISQHVAKALAAQEANCNVGPIIESDSENGDEDENGNGGGHGNGNGRGNGNNGNNYNGNENHGGNMGGAGITARECTYKEFLNYQPFNFKGTEGAL
ncbi:hypothetical protein Tco_0000750 [Tanacetum coccineum]